MVFPMSRKRANPDPSPAASKLKRTSRTTRISSSQPTCSVKRDDGDMYTSVLQGNQVVDRSGLCLICKQTITVQGAEIVSLRCCMCENSFHGKCLSLDEALLVHLHVVVDIGGWCCPQCRVVKKPATRRTIKSTTAEVSQSVPFIDEFRKDLESIKAQISNISTSLSAFPPLPPPVAGPTLFANMVANPVIHQPSQSPPVKDNISSEFKSAVLSTLHNEMKTINRRSANVVVSGLKPCSDTTDSLLFKDLCYTHLGCAIEVTRTSRLGRLQDGRVRPLLVTLTSHKDATMLISMAKTLCSSNDPTVKRDVFINNHLTAAEAKVAYDARVARRSKQSLHQGSSSSSSSPPTNPSSSSPTSHQPLLSSSSIPSISTGGDMDLRLSGMSTSGSG